MDITKLKEEIIAAGEKAVAQLIRVAKEDILKSGDDETPAIAADRLKNAAATKKLAIFDAFEIISRIEQERSMLKEDSNGKSVGFAERRAAKNS